MRIGLGELVVIIVFVIALLRPEKLPEYTEKFLGVMKKVKDCTKEVREATEPVADLKNAVDEQMSSVLNDESEVEK